MIKEIHSIVRPSRLLLLLDAAHTDQIGDGRVWMVDIKSMHRIRDRQAAN